MNHDQDKLNLVVKVFDELGGKKIEDSDGGYWLFNVGSMFLEVEPFIRRTKEGLSVGIDVSMSNAELSRIVNRICGKSGQARQQFDWRQYQQISQTEEHFEVILRKEIFEALKQAEAVDLFDLTARLAAEQPGNRSLSQLMHLAALSYRSDLTTLKQYRDGMQSGKRFGFVPMITDIFLERAVREALAQASKKS